MQPASIGLVTERLRVRLTPSPLQATLSKAKQTCVMGVGVCLYIQLVQTKNKQCKSAIILQCYHVANLLCAQANSASYPQRDGK